MPQIIAPALGGELLKSGLLNTTQVQALLNHAASFPAYPLNRIFLEYEIDRGLSLKRYGHGYTPAEFGGLVGEVSRLSRDRAEALRASLERDPFVDERGYCAEERLPGEPEWIEYDWDSGAFVSTPAVFHVVPKRLRPFSSPRRLDSLFSRLVDLPGDPLGEGHVIREGHVEVVSLLTSLREHTPPSHAGELGVYRIGLSDARGPGWMKLILSGVDADAIRRSCEEHLDVLNVFPRILAIDERFAEVQTSTIAASIDSLHGIVHGVEVACPSFHRLTDPERRRSAVKTFVDQLEADGLLPVAAAAILKENAYRQLETADQEALITLSHMKFGIAGATRGRLRLSFELKTQGHEA